MTPGELFILSAPSGAGKTTLIQNLVSGRFSDLGGLAFSVSHTTRQPRQGELDGRDYHATEPEFLGRREAGPLIRAAFGPLERATFTMLGIRQFLRLRIVPVG